MFAPLDRPIGHIWGKRDNGSMADQISWRLCIGACAACGWRSCAIIFLAATRRLSKKRWKQAIGWFASEGAEVREVTLPNLDFGLGAIFAIELASSGAYHDVSLKSGRVAHFSEDVRTLVHFGRWWSPGSTC